MMRPIAMRSCRSRAAAPRPTTFPVEAIERVIVIGDTPHDIECARVAGARSIAVATGGYTVEQLREFGADDVLPDLSDTEAVLALLSMISTTEVNGARWPSRSSKSVAAPLRGRLGSTPRRFRQLATARWRQRLVVSQTGFALRARLNRVDSQALPPLICQPDPVAEQPLRFEQREAQRRCGSSTSDRRWRDRSGCGAHDHLHADRPHPPVHHQPRAARMLFRRDDDDAS